MSTTEIILTEKIANLGVEADVVKVKRGYARNFLVPRGLALEVTPATLKRLNLLKAKRCRRSGELRTLTHATHVRAAGLVIGRQRPQTASGVTFITIEDEDGPVNVVVWFELAERQRRVFLESQLLAVDGLLESVDGVQHLIAHRLHDLTPLLGDLDARSRDFH